MRLTLMLAVLGSLAMMTPAYGQFSNNGNTTLSVAVAAEAAIRIDTGTSVLATSGTLFNNDFTGATSFTYKIRTARAGGTGNIQLQVTTDFGPTGGPSVGSPVNGNSLQYTCTVASPATGCSSAQIASTSTATNVATFGADAKSAKGGNGGSVSWTLSNDPSYSTGTYTATVQFTISAT
jgi:hypothetical protein